MKNPRGLFVSSTRWNFRCRTDLLPKYTQNLLECGEDGQWRLLYNWGVPVPDVIVEDIEDLCEQLNDYVPRK